MTKRVIVFRFACCTGLAYSYEADDRTQQMIRKHAENYNSAATAIEKRNGDGSVFVYDSVDTALVNVSNDAGFSESFSSLDELFEFCASDGDGMHVDAAWVVHLLLYDGMADDWSVHNFVT